MNAMFLLCQCNSCLTKACGALAPIVQQTNEAGTNCSDVCIADVICRSTIIIVTILVAAFFAWKLIDHNAKENERNFNKKKEEEESKRKQEADLLDKLLDFLKSKASEKNDNKGQQTNNKGLSWTVEDIHKLLKENAANSCSEELRKKYIELCVDILHNLKSREQGSGEPSQGSTESPTSSLVLTGDESKASDVYTGVLCTLIGIYHKNKLSNDDIKALKESCGLKTDNGNPNPENVKHDEKEPKKS